MDILTEPITLLLLLALTLLVASVAWASSQLVAHGNMRRSKAVLVMLITWPIGPLVCLIVALGRGCSG